MGRPTYIRSGCLASAVLVAAFASATASGASSSLISTVAGVGEGGSHGENVPARDTRLDAPRSVALLEDGSLLIADRRDHRIFRLAGGKIATVAGNGDGAYAVGPNPLQASLKHPSGVAAMSTGGFIVADTGNHVIRQVHGGAITTSAGIPRSSDEGDDDIPADESELKSPEDVAPTADGGYLIADTGNHKIRRVSSDGVVTTVAGTGDGDFGGDGGPAEEADLKDPRGVTALPDGGYLVADTGNDRVRRVSPQGEITTVAKQGLDDPVDALPVAGGIAISDSGNDRIHYVTTAGSVETLAGTDSSGYNGDGIAATSAELDEPMGIEVTPEGLIYVADSANHRIRSFLASFAGGVDPGEPPSGGEEESDDQIGSGEDDDGAKQDDDDKALSPPAPPAAGKRVSVAPIRGTVTVRKPGARSYVELTRGASIPVGSVVNARDGAVRLTSAADLRGTAQAGVFHGGAFVVRQKRSRRPVTELVLHGGGLGSCARRAAGPSGPLAYSARRARRGLWGRGHGRFRTRGRNGSATVRGTIWHTQDRCDGTLVRVRRGLVAVRDFRRGRTVNVKAGRSYLARARAPGRRRER